MPQDMALAILRDRLAQMRAQAEIGDGGLPRGPALHRQAAQQNKAMRMQHLPPDFADEAGQGGHRHIGRANGGDVDAAGIEPAHLGIEGGDLGVG